MGNSNDRGRAYEYISLITLYSEISKVRKVRIEHNSSFFATETAWKNVGKEIQELLESGARSFIPTIFELEPLILEDDGDEVELLIQKDEAGERGDVRDILIVRSGIKWEIGLSMKHNHFAVKHSRLSRSIDFGEKWYGHPCSDDYWHAVQPIFQHLCELKAKNMEWKEMTDKSEKVYRPLLDAFMQEIKRTYEKHKELPQKMVEYLLGEYDFYKVISIDNERQTRINAFNLRGSLNKGGKYKSPVKMLPVANLPTRIVGLEFKPNSDNTVELYMDGGWQFSFRIHSASTLVQPSLKFDIQIIGMPTTIVTINCTWI